MYGVEKDFSSFGIFPAMGNNVRVATQFDNNNPLNIYFWINAILFLRSTLNALDRCNLELFLAHWQNIFI